MRSNILGFSRLIFILFFKSVNSNALKSAESVTVLGYSVVFVYTNALKSVTTL